MAKLFVSVIALVFTVLAVNAAENPPSSGSLSEKMPADDTVNQLVDRLKTDIIKDICGKKGKCPSSDAKITVNEYKTQTVAGTNYFVSATIEDLIYHLRIFNQPWTNTEELTEVQGPKQKKDEITYF